MCAFGAHETFGLRDPPTYSRQRNALLNALVGGHSFDELIGPVSLLLSLQERKGRYFGLGFSESVLFCLNLGLMSLSFRLVLG